MATLRDTGPASGFYTARGMYDSVRWIPAEIEGQYKLEYVPILEDEYLTEYHYPENSHFKGWYFNASSEYYTTAELASIRMFEDALDWVDLDCTAWVVEKGEETVSNIIINGETVKEMYYNYMPVIEVSYNDTILYKKGDE